MPDALRDISLNIIGTLLAPSALAFLVWLFGRSNYDSHPRLAALRDHLSQFSDVPPVDPPGSAIAGLTVRSICLSFLFTFAVLLLHGVWDPYYPNFPSPHNEALRLRGEARQIVEDAQREAAETVRRANLDAASEVDRWTADAERLRAAGRTDAARHISRLAEDHTQKALQRADLHADQLLALARERAASALHKADEADARRPDDPGRPVATYLGLMANSLIRTCLLFALLSILAPAWGVGRPSVAAFAAVFLLGVLQLPAVLLSSGRVLDSFTPLLVAAIVFIASRHQFTLAGYLTSALGLILHHFQIALVLLLVPALLGTLVSAGSTALGNYLLDSAPIVELHRPFSDSSPINLPYSYILPPRLLEIFGHAVGEYLGSALAAFSFLAVLAGRSPQHLPLIQPRQQKHESSLVVGIGLALAISIAGAAFIEGTLDLRRLINGQIEIDAFVLAHLICTVGLAIGVIFRRTVPALVLAGLSIANLLIDNSYQIGPLMLLPAVYSAGALSLVLTAKRAPSLTAVDWTRAILRALTVLAGDILLRYILRHRQTMSGQIISVQALGGWCSSSRRGSDGARGGVWPSGRR